MPEKKRQTIMNQTRVDHIKADKPIFDLSKESGAKNDPMFKKRGSGEAKATIAPKPVAEAPKAGQVKAMYNEVWKNKKEGFESDN